ncbi:hypothetical protein VTI74DRAFT_11274 [Chaetomium olivicolor]
MRRSSAAERGDGLTIPLKTRSSTVLSLVYLATLGAGSVARGTTSTSCARTPTPGAATPALAVTRSAQSPTLTDSDAAKLRAESEADPFHRLPSYILNMVTQHHSNPDLFRL